MKITKSLAADVAKAMTNQTVGNKITEIKKDNAKIASELLKKLIPDVVQKAFSYSPGYFNTSTNVMFKSDGLPEIKVDMMTKIPSKTSWYDIIIIERDSYEQLKSNDIKLKKLYEERDLLTNTIETTLLSLSTLKRVEESLPESLSYFPQWCFDDKSAKPSLPLDDIKKMLKKYK